MAELLGVKYEKVIIRHDPLDDSFGYLLLKPMIGESDRTFENIGFVYLAGSIAEICCLQQNDQWQVDTDVREAIRRIIDVYYYRDFYTKLTKEEKKNLLKFVLTEKKELVFAFFNDPRTTHATRYLARILMRKGRLSQASVRSLNLRSRLTSRYAKELKEFASKRQWI